MSARLAPRFIVPQPWRRARCVQLRAQCGQPSSREVELAVELEVVRGRAQSAAARGRRLSESAQQLRMGAARAAAEGDAASVAQLERDRALVLNAIGSVLRRVSLALPPCLLLRCVCVLTRLALCQLDVYRMFAEKVEQYLAALSEDEPPRDDRGNKS